VKIYQWLDNLGYVDKEEWRTVPSLPLYEVSNFGRVRSQYRQGRRTPDGILKLSVDRKGYLRVSPTIKCKKYTVPVHILVAETFIGPCQMGFCVHHKDGVKQNNKPENLEYMKHCTHTSINKRGAGASFTKLIWQQVIEIRWLYRLNFCIKEISQMTGINYGTIHSIIIRKSWKHI
jgi:hypothetical protein